MQSSRTLKDADRGRGSRSGGLLWAVWLLLAGLSLAPPEAAADKVSGRLLLQDVLTVPSRPVRIEARLVREGLLGPTGLGGEQLELIVGGKSAGHAMTGGDGRALFDYTSRMRGNYVITVRLAATKRVDSPETSAILACWERRRPILLVDMAALTEEPRAPVVSIASVPPSPSVPSSSINVHRRDRPAPVPDAADELKRLSDYYFNVIYLSRSGQDGAPSGEDERAWLRQHRLPPGFLVMVPSGQAALAGLIDRMRAEGWDNLKGGVGRTAEFASVLVEHRMDAVLISVSKDEPLPKKAYVAKDWKEVRKKLQA
ncbi:MAG: hypothetical protein HY205_06720 [Nitrospirae bacterium]|nr:hypothetical protein [Nitrospirota bacterium]